MSLGNVDSRQQGSPVHSRSSSVQRPHTVQSINDDGLDKEQLRRRDAVPGVGRVDKGLGRVPFFAVGSCKELMCMSHFHEGSRHE
ncbi:hypothetical protein SCP_1103450 [Sparassis crispa]|uniref:Uncharacterized protein n=1 Tax=Sparassis crispa TaxID=139825 RepID=A0A401GZT6_9APHY|nr:hypothetical protein SCP_1103450 [Sparassis crispa]GBE87668.1 hypothetical protein SCP_1103450 [Sparassis crispa]